MAPTLAAERHINHINPTIRTLRGRADEPWTAGAAMRRDDDDLGRTLPDPREEPRAFEELVEAHRRYLLFLANRRMRPELCSKAGASDIVQETMLEAQLDPRGFQGRTKDELRAWLRRILLNNLANFERHYLETQGRQVGREVSLDHESPSGRSPKDVPARSGATGSGYAVRREEAEALAKALARLTERERLVLTWRYQEQCSFPEIGRRLGGTADMARKVWLHAIEKLRGTVPAR